MVVADRALVIFRPVSAGRSLPVADSFEEIRAELLVAARPVVPRAVVEPVVRDILPRPELVPVVRDVLLVLRPVPVVRDVLPRGVDVALRVPLVCPVFSVWLVGVRMAVVAPRTMEGRAVVVGVRARIAVVVPRRMPLGRGVLVVGRAIPVAPPRAVPRPVVAMGVRLAVVAPRTMLPVRVGVVRMAAPDRPADDEDGLAWTVWVLRAAW